MYLIVTGGDPPAGTLFAQEAARAEFVIAADRGAWYCLQAGRCPDLVVGDMDSLPHEVLHELRRQSVEVMVLRPDKDETDTQIAIQEALRRGACSITILAALGSRFDHSLANVHLLFPAHRAGVPAQIVTEQHRIFLVEGDATITDAQGSTISFLPLGMRASGITLQGFAFELHDATLELGYPRGISNVITDAQARVTVREGILVALLMKPGGEC